MDKRILGATVATCAALLYFNRTMIDHDSLEKRYSEQNVVEQVGIVGYLAEDIKETVKDALPQDKKYLKEQIERFYDEHEVQVYPYKIKKEIKNIILIQLEGVDSVLLDLMNDGKYVMPNLHQLKEEGIWFPNVYDQTGSGRTSDGEFLTLTSLLQLDGQSMYTHYNLENLLSLPKILSGEGYVPISLHGNTSSFWNRKKSHQALGYEESYYAEDIESEVEENYNGWGYSDRTMLRQTLKVLKSHDEPVLSHTILLTTHHPYDAVNEMDLDLPFKNTDSLLENYFNCLYYTDLAVGEFVDGLAEAGILDGSLLIIYADHDSGLTEDVYHYMGLSYNSDDPNCDKVPLIIYDGENRYVEKMPVGQSDTMPLILSYLNVELPDYIYGANYIDGRKVVYTHNCIIKGPDEIISNTYDLDAITKLLIKGSFYDFR